MKVKKILALVLTVSVVGSTTAFAYANQKAVAATKNVVVTAEQKNITNNVSISSISNEQAVKMAYKAVKDYMGKDASFYSGTHVCRPEDEEKENEVFEKKFPKEVAIADAAKKKFEAEHPEIAQIIEENKAEVRNNPIITVWLIPAKYNQDKACSNFVDINERTGEIVNVTSINDMSKSTDGQINDDKVKEATLKFMQNIGKQIDSKTLSINNDNGNLSQVSFTLKDGRKAGVEVNLEDYTVVHYQVEYMNIKPLPSLPNK